MLSDGRANYPERSVRRKVQRGLTSHDYPRRSRRGNETLTLVGGAAPSQFPNFAFVLGRSALSATLRPAVKWLQQLRSRTERQRAAPALDTLLTGIGPDASLATRVAWLEKLLAWVRRDTPANRLRLLLQILEHQPETRLRVAMTLRALLRETQALDLFTETGLPRAAGFFREASERFLRRLLPRPPVGPELGDLFDHLFPAVGDAKWLAAVEPELAERIAGLWQHGRAPGEPAWEALSADLEDALVLIAARIRVIGTAPAIRSRLTPCGFRELPFQKLGPAVETLIQRSRDGADTAALAAELNYIRTLDDACARALDDVTARLEEAGVSMAVVYDLERLRALLHRLELLLEAWGDPHLPPIRGVLILADLVRENHARGSVRELARQNLHLLTRSLVERSAETGEHYLAHTRREYLALLRSSLGGGALTALTTLVKLAMAGVVLAGFLEGLLAGLNYAASFVLIQLFGFTLATKQPATTAPALARRMHELRDTRHREGLVDEIVMLVRSQMAAVIGNLAAVFPVVLLLDWLWVQVSGAHWVTSGKAEKIIESLDPFNGTLVFAVFTGGLLWLSSMIAAWADNSFALHRLRPALAGNRSLQVVLGTVRTQRFAAWLDHNIAGLAGNLSLGFLLGLTPKIADFIGLPLDVRHVTLSTGQFAAAWSALGPHALNAAEVLTIVGLFGIGAINLGVSFGLALTVAIRARDVPAPDRGKLYRALLRRVVRRPWTFLVPGGDPPWAPDVP